MLLLGFTDLCKYNTNKVDLFLFLPSDYQIDKEMNQFVLFFFLVSLVLSLVGCVSIQLDRCQNLFVSRV